MAILRRSYGYSKVHKEDPDEIIHRRAQFLIYKVLEQANPRRKSSFLGIRLCKLKVKIGRKLRKLKKTVTVSISGVRVGVYKQVLDYLRTWIRLFNRGDHRHASTIAAFHRPLLT